MTKAEVTKALAALSEKFPVGEVKQRTQGGMKLDYISIDSTIRRFNSVLGADWATTGVDVSVTPEGNGKYLATVSLNLEALGKTALGVGADVANDADKAVKTALAEALKKAGHQFGVGLYLWDESERDALAQARASGAAELRLLQVQAKERFPGKSGAEIAEALGITEADLRDPEILGAALAKDGAV